MEEVIKVTWVAEDDTSFNEVVSTVDLASKVDTVSLRSLDNI